MKLLKILAVVCLTILTLLAGAVAAIRFFFPTDQIRRQLERTLSEQLQGTVRIASLEWDLLRGIHLGQVDIERNGGRFAQFDRLSLRYQLRSLLQGTLAMTEVALTRPTIFIDLARFPEPSEAQAPPLRDEAVRLPTLPLAVQIESIRLDHAQITIVRGNDLHVDLHDVNLSARLHAGPKTADLSGMLDIANIDALLHRHQWQLPLRLTFALSVDVPAERLVLEQLDIRSDPLLHLVVTGQVDHLVSIPEVAFSVREGSLDLESLLSLAQPMLPPSLTDARLAGTIAPSISIAGAQTDKGFDGRIRLDIKGNGIHGSSSSLGISLEPTSVRAQTGEITVHENRLGPVHAAISISTPALATETATVRDLIWDLQADRSEAGQLAAHVTMKAVISASLASTGPRFSEPLTFEADATADETALTFSLAKVKASVGDIVHLAANGAIGPPGKAGTERPLSIQVGITSDTVKLLRIVPPSLLQGFEPASDGGPQTASLNMTGSLDSEWRPLRAAVHLSLNAAGLRATSTKQQLAGTVERAALTLRAWYQAKGNSLKGAVDGTVLVKDLRQGTTAAVGSATVTLDGEIGGYLRSDLAIRRLTAVTNLTSEIRNVRYTTPTVGGTFEHLTASVKAHANLLNGPYVLDSAHLTAGRLLDCTASGTFHPRNRQFAIEAAVPLLNVAEVPRHLSGPAVESLPLATPTGSLSLRITGSGSIPTADDLAQLRIPVRALVQVDLQNVSGSFQDHAVTGATGTISLSVHPPGEKPNKLQIIETSSRIRADHIGIGGDVPVKQLKHVTLSLEGSVQAFDRLIIERFSLRADGMEANAEVEVAGLKQFLARKEGTPLLDGLGPLFVKSSLNAHLDLNGFTDTIRSFGIAGSGRAGLTLVLHKKERGPVDVHLTVLPQEVSVAQNEHRVEDLDGAIELRKVLQWMAPHDGKTREAAFRPTGLLPDLHLTTPSRQNIRIKRISTGAIEIRNLSGRLFLNHNRLVFQNLAMNLLGGGLGGEIAITGGKAFRVDLRLEAAGLDANHLLPAGEQIPGDSLIDATITATTVFDAQQGRLDFGTSTLDVSLTRIGRHTLDRLLRFLDPTGGNPSIVGARSAVKLANPSSARLTLSKGLMAIHISFQEGLLSRFEMDRLPVSQIKQIRDFTATVPQWEEIRRLMRLLGADRYGVDQTGEFVLE